MTTLERITMNDQYTHIPVDSPQREVDNYQHLQEQMSTRHTVMEERIIAQQNDIAKLRREVARLKNQIDSIQYSINTRG